MKPKFLLCKKCNQDFDKIDAGICKAFDFFDSYLLVRKDRKTGFKTIIGDLNGEKVLIKDGRPEFAKMVDEKPNGSKRIRAVDPDKVQKILNGMRNKYQDALKVRKKQTEMIGKINVPMNIISPEAWRGIAKILFDAIFYFNNDYQSNENLIKMIVERPWEEVSRECPITFAPKEINIEIPPALNRNEWSFYHCVIIEYRPQENCVIGYVEIYNLPYIALLDDNYSGKSGCIGYFVNPLTGEDQKLLLSKGIPISRQNLKQSIQEWLTTETLSLFSKRLSSLTVTAIHYNEIRRAIDIIVKKSNLTEDDIFTEESINQLINQLEPMILNYAQVITFPNRVFEVLYHSVNQWQTIDEIQSALLRENIKSDHIQIERAIKIFEMDPNSIEPPLYFEKRETKGISKVRITIKEKKVKSNGN